MIKHILRSGLGVFFFIFFLVFLLVGSVKSRLMSADYWKSALRKGDVYQLMQVKTTEMRTQTEAALKKETKGKTIPKELTALFKIADQLTADRFRELIETNLDRFFGYFSGKDEKLTLFIPVKEWKLPLQALKQPALLQLTGQTSAEQVMTALGYKQENITEIMKGVVQFKNILGYVPTIWSILLMLIFSLGVAYFLLGDDFSDKLSGTAWLLTISGAIASFIGFGANTLITTIVTNIKPPLEPRIAMLGKDLIGQFFYEWQMIGILVSGIGFITLLTMFLLKKQGKIQEEKEKMGLVKNMIAFMLGIFLDVVIVFALVLALVQTLGGKIGLKMDQGKDGVRVENGSGAEKK